MLALPIQTRGPAIVALDDVEPSKAYVALARPRVARRADGSSMARLVRWVRAAAPDETTGARLSLDIEVEPTPEEISAIGLEPAKTELMPWSHATVSLDGPGFDRVEVSVSSVLAGRGAVAVDLSADAGALLASLLTGVTVSPLQVTWRGVVPVRLPAVEVTASADIAETKRRTTMLGPNSSRTTIRQVINAIAHIEIRNAGNPALEDALRVWVLDELTSQLAQGKATLRVRASAADVVEWPIELSTTLDDLVPRQDRGSIVETIVLDDTDLGKVPQVEVRVLGDFSRLDRVDVRLTSSGASTELSFTTDAPQRVSIDGAAARWAHRVKRRDTAAGEWSSPLPLPGPTSLIVPVPQHPTRRIEVFGSGLDFAERWASVTASLSARRGATLLASHSIELTSTNTSGHWIAPAADTSVAIAATLTYLSRYGQAIEETIDPVEGDHVLARDPLAGTGLRVTLLPSGTGWSDVATAMIDVRYTDRPHVIERTLELHKLTDLAEWNVPARVDGPKTIEWRMHVSRVDGGFEAGQWQAAPAGVVVVRLDGTPRRLVQVLPVFFDPQTTRSATMRLRTGAHTETISISDRNAKSVTLPPGPMSWTIQWTMIDGRELDESAALDGDDVIVVPRAPRR